MTAYNTSFKTKTPHATSTCMSRILQSVSHFRCVSQRLYPTGPQSVFRLRTLSCTGMPSLYPSPFPGAFTKYSFFFLTTREHLFAHVCQVYRKHTFRHAGPSKDILRMYAVWFCWALLLEQHISTYLFTVRPRGFGQHPAVRLLFGQRNGALGRSTSSWCHKGAFFAHRRV